MRLIRHIFLLLNWIAALLLFASTLGSIPPSQFIGFSLLSYCYFPLLLVNVLFIVVWLCASSKHFLLSTITIILRWSFVPAFFQVGGHPETPSDEASVVRVMSFNMHHFYGKNYINNTADIENGEPNAIAFVQLIRENDPDIICCQEFLPYTGKIDLRDSLNALGYSNYVAAAPAYGHSSSILWTKLPVVGREYIDSSRLVRVDVVKGTDTMRVFSLHMHSYGLTEDDKGRIDSIYHGEDIDKSSVKLTLLKFTEAIKAHEEEWDVLRPMVTSSPYPVILAGDFNDHPASYLYLNIRKELKDSYRERGKGFCTTYSGRFPAFRIDYIFHSDQFKALSYKRIKSNISDHYPITVELELKR